MSDKATSILARLKNVAISSGRNYQLCLQLFCQEEFLRRLEHSKYSDNFILKGGLFLYVLTEFDSRVTVDIDFLISSIPNTSEKIKEVVNEIINEDTGNDYISFKLIKVEPIALQKKYQGIGVSLITYIKNTKTPFSIDFGFGDIIIPKSEKRSIPTQLPNFSSPQINTYSIETTIAEKIDAILELMEFSSRMKDYYDIYYLCNKFTFDGNILTKAIKETINNRNHHFIFDQFEEIINYHNNDNMNKKWNAFKKKINIDVEYDCVLESISKFLYEPFKSVLESTSFEKQWSPLENAWR